MTPMAPPRPTRSARPNPATPFRECRVRLAATLAAAAQARAEIEETLRAWRVPLDPEIPVLLTSELVANAVTHGAGKHVILAVSYGCDELRVDVHDASGDLPVLADVPPEAESGRGLLLVTSLSSEWGFYRTPAGKAVYFVLKLPPEVVSGLVDDAQNGSGPKSVS
jgi:anti-sigma regulatory factor (Ser/Thr protein kinase)